MDLGRVMKDDVEEGHAEMDTHADTCVAGPEYRVLSFTGEKVNVHPYNDEYEPVEDVPIAMVETTYTCPDTGETIILVGHQHLYFGDRLKHSLWNPNQLRHGGTKVFDCPKQFDIDSPFSVHFENDVGDILDAPLKLNGVMPYLDVHYPTDEELDGCRRFKYTSDETWDPYSPVFEDNDRAAKAYDEYRVAQVMTK